MNYDQVIAGLNKDLQHTRKLENEAGPVQQMSAGATSALLQIAIQLAQLNKTVEAATIAKPVEAAEPSPGPTAETGEASGETKG